MDSKLLAKCSSDFAKFLKSPSSLANARKILNTLYDHISGNLKYSNDLLKDCTVLENWVQVAYLVQTKFNASDALNEFVRLTFKAMYHIVDRSGCKDVQDFLSQTSILYIYIKVYKKLIHLPNKRLLLAAASRALQVAKETNMEIQHLCKEFTIEICDSTADNDLIQILSHHWDSYVYQDIRVQFGNHLTECCFLNMFDDAIKCKPTELSKEWLSTFNSALHSIKFVKFVCESRMYIFENLLRNFLRINPNDAISYKYLLIFDSLLVTSHFKLNWKEEAEVMNKIRPIFEPHLKFFIELVKENNEVFILYSINVLTIIGNIDDPVIAKDLKSTIKYVLKCIQFTLDDADLSHHFEYNNEKYLSGASFIICALNRLLINDEFKEIVAKSNVVNDLLEMLENPGAPFKEIMSVFVHLFEFGNTKEKLKSNCDFQSLLKREPNRFKIPDSLKEDVEFTNALDLLMLDKPSEQTISPENNKVMLSYQWNCQSVVLELKKFLFQKGFKVWMDVDKMHGNIYQRMAEGIESSEYIIAFITKHYKESANCRKELSYAESLRRNIIPIYIDASYRPDGWLGLIIGWHTIFIALKPRVIETGQEICHQIQIKNEDVTEESSKNVKAHTKSSKISEEEYKEWLDEHPFLSFIYEDSFYNASTINELATFQQELGIKGFIEYLKSDFELKPKQALALSAAIRELFS